MKQRYRKLKQRDNSLTVDLFPFLSILICLVGVLAFLQILMSVTGSRKIELVGDVGEGYKAAYQIFCFQDGIIAVPPVERLYQLERKTAERWRQDVNEIRRERNDDRAYMTGLGKNYDDAMIKTNDENLSNLLDEIDFVNGIARETGFQYEEFLLFGIYPDGGRSYHKIRDFINRS